MPRATWMPFWKTRRPLGPPTAIEQCVVAAALIREAAELLQEERHTLRDTLVAEFAEPGEFGRACSPLALATRDEPMDTRQVDGPERTDQWLCGHEADVRRNLAKMIDTRIELVVLDCHSRPHVTWPRKSRRELCEPT